MTEPEPTFDIERIRAMTRRAIAPVKPEDESTEAADDFVVSAMRTEAGRALPKYYLVYFLLVDLLGFRDLGRFEKVAWSVPVDCEGTAYLIEYGKFGISLFAVASDDSAEENAKRIVGCIARGVREAEPFFRWMAASSKFNVMNNGAELFERHQYFHALYDPMAAEAEARKNEWIVEHGELTSGVTYSTTFYPGRDLIRKADWLAMATIDAFFACTEHIFIHLAILQGRVTTARESTPTCNVRPPAR